MSKNSFATAGMVISALVVLMGILTMCGAFGGDATIAGAASYRYDSGYASFGGDFYSYVNNNAAEASAAARTTAKNVKELVDLTKTVGGIFLMSVGLFGLCGFGIVRCSCAAPVSRLPEETPSTSPEADSEAENSALAEPQNAEEALRE